MIYNKLFAWKGSFGIVPPNLDGMFVSDKFPTYQIDDAQVHPGFLRWYFRLPYLWDQAQELSTGSAAISKLTLNPPKFLELKLPAPPLKDQERIVGRIDKLVAKIEVGRSLVQKWETVADSLLMAEHHKIVDDAPRRRLGDVAPLIRRPADIDPSSEYPGVSVRSFGNGTFHNPPLHGSEITWQKPHLVKEGDILVSNIKAWEGALAVAGPDDDGRYGSHRYLTFVPVDDVATADFLCFHLLSPEGLYHVGEASPGSADRNRTLSSKKMLDIEVPVPPYCQQQRFDRLLARISAARHARNDASNARDALLPSILDRAFRGEL